MKTLHDGPSLLLTQHDDKLILDLRRKASWTREQVNERVGMAYAGDDSWTGDATDQVAILKAVEQLDQPRMHVLHQGKNLLLKRDKDELILDVNWGGKITRDQIAEIERMGMVNTEEDTWRGDAQHEAGILRFVKHIDRDWVSRRMENLATQQYIGGR